jgi:hypothetical protein
MLERLEQSEKLPASSDWTERGRKIDVSDEQ